jgi:hypothetical protein
MKVEKSELAWWRAEHLAQSWAEDVAWHWDGHREGESSRGSSRGSSVDSTFGTDIGIGDGCKDGDADGLLDGIAVGAMDSTTKGWLAVVRLDPNLGQTLGSRMVEKTV